MLQVSTKRARPLDSVSIRSDQPGTIRVYDGDGRLYFQSEDAECSVRASGALGTHVVSLHDAQGVEKDRARFKVECETELEENTGRYRKLMHMLKTTFFRRFEGARNTPSDNERVYRLQSVTSRDTILVYKGAKYFVPAIKDVIDLFSKYQPESGMIWDFGISKDPDSLAHFEWRWGEQFSQRHADGKLLFARQPIMNDLEHMYIRGLHQSWQATGDDEWMATKLDSALAAMRFVQKSPYTWSEKFQLIKRTYTIDLWDYQSKDDAALVDGDAMDAKPGNPNFTIFHGDNIGMADACRKLAEMLRRVGRDEDAQEAADFAEHLQTRIDEIAWNGEFYTHMVPENPEFKRDLGGVDESRQVSLSNTYDINRGIDHDKAVAIIQTYQRIREEMPESSPAEFFGIYPPFPKGFMPPWWYTNGGVTIMTAGELAHGSFEHGYEQYGADILRRIVSLFEPYGDAFYGGLRGADYEPPARTFQPLDLRPVANADLVCREGQEYPGWTDQPGLDMANLPKGTQTFEEVPFEILDGDQNEHRAMLRLNRFQDGYADSASIPVGGAFGGLYLLHAASGGSVVGEVRFEYEDGSEWRKYILQGKQVLGFWNPEQPENRRVTTAELIVPWTGPSQKFRKVGLSAVGIKNPHPDKPVKQIEFLSADEPATWLIVAATTSDAPPFFQPQKKEYHGVPPRWGAGAMMYALVEGIAGIYDADRNFQIARIAPRWAAAEGVNDVITAVRYADGGGYIRYRYRRDGNTLRLEAAGNAEHREIELLLPQGAAPKAARLNGETVNVRTKTLEQSTYVCLASDGLGVSEVEVDLED